MPFRPKPILVNAITILANRHFGQCHFSQCHLGQNPFWSMPLPFWPIDISTNAISANAISANSHFGQFSLVSMRIAGMHNCLILTSCRISYLIYCFWDKYTWRDRKHLFIPVVCSDPGLVPLWYEMCRSSRVCFERYLVYLLYKRTAPPVARVIMNQILPTNQDISWFCVTIKLP